jgi:hypothetical protein
VPGIAGLAGSLISRFIDSSFASRLPTRQMNAWRSQTNILPAPGSLSHLVNPQVSQAWQSVRGTNPYAAGLYNSLSW